MKMEWIYIDEVEVNENIRGIHCDTRDFGVLTVEEPTSVEILDFVKDVKRKPEAYEQCLFDSWEEIKKYLKDLENSTGGKGKWRFISFNYPYKGAKYLAQGWHKYFRFAKIDDKWFAYTIEGGNYYVIRKDFVNLDTLIKDEQVLNFH